MSLHGNQQLANEQITATKTGGPLLLGTDLQVQGVKDFSTMSSTKVIQVTVLSI